jgi:hypothetical protein
MPIDHEILDDGDTVISTVTDTLTGDELAEGTKVEMNINITWNR